MNRLAFTLLLLGAPALAAPKTPAKESKESAQTADKAADSPLLTRMKTLVGTWKLSMGEMTATTTFKTTGGGKCVTETMAMAPGKEMMTVYCADGEAIMATHYCDGGTQPRMRAERLSGDGKTLDFQFKDITNLKTPETPHMRTVKFTWQGGESITEEWGSYNKGGKDTPTVFTLTRVK